MAFAAVTGSFSLSSCFLGGVAAFLIIGTDIAYALQDYEFDCKNQLFSVPSQFGIKKSIQISMWTHFLSLLALLGVGLSAHLPMLYYFLLPVAALIFIFFHLFLRKPRNEFINLEASFFYCNVAISFSVLIFIALSLVWRALL